MSIQANNRDEQRLIAENFSLLMKNRGSIRSHSQLGKAWSPAMYLSVAYITGGGLVPLGFLFKAWDQGLMTGYCPNCDGDQSAKSLHLFNVGGSVLSGANSCWGVCSRCQQPSDFTYTAGSDGVLFAQWIGKVIALKEQFGISDDYAVQWLGVDTVQEARGGMIVSGERVFANEAASADVKRNPALSSVPPSLKKLVETLGKTGK